MLIAGWQSLTELKSKVETPCHASNFLARIAKKINDSLYDVLEV